MGGRALGCWFVGWIGRLLEVIGGCRYRDVSWGSRLEGGNYRALLLEVSIARLRLGS